MSPRVDCEDCAYSDDVDDLLEASDIAEEHEAKEHHRVSIERVATDGGTTLYLTTLVCPNCTQETTIAHEGAPTPVDQEPPVPPADWCPACTKRYDHGRDTVEVREAEVVGPEEPDNPPWDWQVRGLTATNLYDDAVQEWGADAQGAKASEECAELAAVLARDLNRQATVDELLQEMVDVRIMLEQLARTYGLSQRELQDTVTERLQHLDDRLDGGQDDE